MKKLHYYFPHLFLIFLTCLLQGQQTPYILEDGPVMVSELENLLINEKLDSVKLLAQQIIENDSNTELIKATAYFYKGQAEALDQQFNPALYSYDEATKLFTAEGYTKGLAMCYGQKGHLVMAVGNTDDALSLYSLSIQNANERKDCGFLVEVYQKKARLHFDKNELDTAFFFLRKALDCSYMTKNKRQQINTINQISTNYHSLGELDSAIYYFKKSINIKKEIEDSDGLISDYSALGNLYKERGDYEVAQQYLMDALNIAEIELDSFSLTTIYSELGDIYAAQRIWNVSEDYYNRSLQIAKKKKSRFMAAGCLSKMGNIFQKQNRDSLAIEYKEEALKIYSELNNKVKIAEMLVNLSSLYQEKKQFEKAKILLLESIKVNQNSQDVISTLKAKLALAEIEIKLGNYTSGIKYAEECYASFELMKDKENLRNTSLILAHAYYSGGYYKKAFDFYKYYSQVNDSLISVERAEAIKKYDLLNTTKKKDREIALQNEKIQSQQVDLLRKNNQLIMLAGGFGFIALLAVFLYFIYNKNKQLNAQRIQALKKEQESQILKSIIDGEEKERKRFARELHDGLGAVLSTVKMQISGIPRDFPEVRSSTTYQKAEMLIDDACRSVREISHDLMPHVLEQQGLISAVEDMCHNLSTQYEIRFDFIPFGNEYILSDLIKITLYRITQELLKNIIKHAQATEVIVQLTIEEEETILIVEDNGKGFEPTQDQKGIGLANIRSRAEYLKGTFEIETTFNQGSTFTIQLPNKTKNV